MSTYSYIISKELALKATRVTNTIKLLEGGATIPFISRYRKEATENLDEVQVAAIQETLEKLKETDKRRKAIIKSIEEQEKLTDELRQQLENTWSLTELEDLYLPYKPKRKTKAVVAKEKGLEPLAKIIMSQKEPDIESRATQFLNAEVKGTDAALQGARDIIAEWISERKAARDVIRKLFSKKAIITSKVVKGKEEEGDKYKDYFDWEEPLQKCPSHRMLAMRRAETEGILRIKIAPPEKEALENLEGIFVKSTNEPAEQVKEAVTDSYKRLLFPSIENEFRGITKEKADEEAIKVFSDNLRQLLLAAPLGAKRTLAIDPGFRTGCKLVCLDEQGNLLHNETIYPHPPQKETGKAVKKINSLVNAYKVEAIAIGNATAGRETEHMIRRIRFEKDILVFVVNESGASVYSASSAAREEFPQFDVTVRGAVSIGRRLMDPLAELVKIDPKSIGVGQYQHDVDQKKLKESLDRVVESCVNLVGVDLNTASRHLLSYISGLGPQLAQKIVDYRKENGAFQSRKELEAVPKMGAKTFEQSAGFLRIRGGKNPLDNTAVHPESYSIVEKMAKDLNSAPEDLVKNKTLIEKVDPEKYVSGKIGLPTLNDILEELKKPGRDPRKQTKVFEFQKGIFSIEDLKEGMVLPGIITNVTNFGAFVDVGVKENGLVHVSQLKDEYVSNPADVVQLHQHVKVKVMSIDIERKRIGLTMKEIDR